MAGQSAEKILFLSICFSLQNLLLEEKIGWCQKVKTDQREYMDSKAALEKEVIFLKAQLQHSEAQVLQEQNNIKHLLKKHAEQLAHIEEQHKQMVSQ